MKLNKILLVGNGNSPFIYNLAKNLKNKNNRIDILSLIEIDKKNISHYDNIYEFKSSNYWYSMFNKIRGLRFYIHIYFLKKINLKYEEYDFIHFHYVSKYVFSLLNFIKKNSKAKIIISIWGTDLYSLFHPRNLLLNFYNTLITKKHFIYIINIADKITIANNETKQLLVNSINFKNHNKILLTRFGSSALDEMENLNLEKSDCKIKLGWDTRKLSITVGYNLSKGQQHLLIIDEFLKLDLQDKVQLILPLTYGGTNSYKLEIIKKLNKSNYSYIIYDDYISDIKVAEIRTASDIMIQLQISDQFSASMQEYIYAENVVITGSWLPYKTLKENGIWFLEIDEITSLHEKLGYVFKNLDEFMQKTKFNKESIIALTSWKSNINNWSLLYK